MDAEKLIEEAGRWAESIRRSPGKGTAGEDLYGAKLLTDLATALRAECKRIVELEQETDGLHDALRTCDESRKELIDGLKTARDTLDLGKRLIQALQHERDTARAELARLTTPRPIAEAPKDERSRILARGRDGQWREMRLVRGEWRWFGAGNEHIESPTEYLPLPVLP